jgi:hypothetical protein
MNKKILSMILAILSSGSTYANNENIKENEKNDKEFAINIQLRSRAEYRNGALFPRESGVSSAGFINNRARLSLSYVMNNLKLKVSGQQVGVWGQDPMINKNGRFDLNEAWGEMNLGNGFFARIGRQEIAYDDERILGTLEWHVAGRFHDALKIGYEKNRHRLHGIFAFNQNEEKPFGGNYYNNGYTGSYKNMQTLWYNYSSSYPLSISLLLMNIGQETGNYETKVPDTKYMQTMGIHLTYKNGQLGFKGSFYYQTGENVQSRKVSSFTASAVADYSPANNFGLIIGTDYLSGSKNSNSNSKAFNPLYGSHHLFYGSMDYFYATPFKNNMNPGLLDIYYGVKYSPNKRVLMSLNYHYFATGVELKGINRTLGSEFDYSINIKLMQEVSMSAGYSFMLGTSSMDTVKGGNHDSWQDWGWVSLNINPRLFFSKW